MQNNVNTNISWYEGHNYQKFAQKNKIFHILCTKYMANSEAMTSSTHSFAYSYGLVKKFAKLESVITSLFVNRFLSGFHCFLQKILLFLLKLS